MKKYILFYSLLTFLYASPMLGQQNDMERAIEKGKSDLIELLRTTKDNFNFGLQAAAVEQATGKTGIPYMELDFQKLLNYDNQNMEALVTPPQKYIVPLISSERQVVTTITVSDNKRNGYKVVELVNQQYQKELNMLPEEIKENDFRNLNIVFEPNLNTTLYQSGEKIYTNYDNYSIRQAIDVQVLLQKLKADARDFQDKYGEAVKKNKLVH